MSSTYDTIEGAYGYQARVNWDTDGMTENPRTSGDCHVAVISCRNDHRHYTLGDPDHQFDIGELTEDLPEGVTPLEAVKAWLVAEKGAIPETFVGLAMTDHSGQTLHVDVPDGSKGTTAYMGLDSAFIGWAFATAETVAETGAPAEGLRDQVVEEAREYGRWMAGETYWIEVVDEDGDQVECCYGYIGSEYAKEAAVEMLDAVVNDHVAKLEAANAANLERVAEALAGPPLVESV